MARLIHDVGKIAIPESILNKLRKFSEPGNYNPALTSKGQGAVMRFVVDGGGPAGVIDYLMENPSDKIPWVGLLMIHSDYHGLDYAVEALMKYASLTRNSRKRDGATRCY